MKKINVSLFDTDDEAVSPFGQVEIELGIRGLEFNFPNLGTKCIEPGVPDVMGAGGPVYIEYRKGVPHVIVWADITKEDPTHVISLAGAHESMRPAEVSAGL